MLKSILVFGLTRRPIVVLAVMVFLGAGIFAFTRLNIEAYPNPAPVILEITAQAPGLSAEEMEKYYTIPMEIALYPAPGVVNIRSTSFYGLSFVRVTFRYGIDFDTAYANAAVYMQQGVNLPGNQVPQIQQSSLVGEIVRYQVVGPPNIGLTNLRTIEDWVVARRLLTIPGVVAVVGLLLPPRVFDLAIGWLLLFCERVKLSPNRRCDQTQWRLQNIRVGLNALLRRVQETDDRPESVRVARCPGGNHVVHYRF